jgi:hypothetical protein
MDAFSNNFNENDVRMIAHEYLQWHYRKSDIIGGIYAETEAKTKAGKFADGFYAFRRTHNTIYIASLECKKELDSTSLDFRIHPERLVRWILIFASVFNIGFFILWFQYNKLFGLYLEPLTIVLIVLFFLFLYRFTEKYFIKNEPSQLLIRNVFHQLEQYPADEQWLAFSTPKPNDDKQYERCEAIKKDCQRKGIGLLLVDMDTEQVVWKKLPKSKTRSVGNFLRHYQKAEAIETKLMQHETKAYNLNKRTPAQKRFYWRLVIPLLLIICTALYYRLTFNTSSVPMAKNIQESEEKEEPQPIVEQEIEQIIEQEIEPILASTTVVLDNVYADSTEAKWRVKKLHQLGLEAQLGNISDYELDLNINNDYFVFLEDAEGELRLLFDKYKKKLFDEDVEVINAKIIEIKKKTTGKESKEIDR